MGAPCLVGGGDTIRWHLGDPFQGFIFSLDQLFHADFGLAFIHFLLFPTLHLLPCPVASLYGPFTERRRMSSDLKSLVMYQMLPLVRVPSPSSQASKLMNKYDKVRRNRVIRSHASMAYLIGFVPENDQTHISEEGFILRSHKMLPPLAT